MKATTVVQYLIAGTLAVAWLWILGRPLVAGLFKRSRKGSIGYFRQQQAVLAAAGGFEAPPKTWRDQLPRPISAWRAQNLEKRRLQSLLGSAIAVLVSAFCAIAFKGLFVPLLVLLFILSMIHLVFAAFVGSKELRSQQAHARTRRAADKAQHLAAQRASAASIIDQADGTQTAGRPSVLAETVSVQSQILHRGATGPGITQTLGIFEQQTLFGLAENQDEHVSIDEQTIDGVVIESVSHEVVVVEESAKYNAVAEESEEEPLVSAAILDRGFAEPDSGPLFSDYIDMASEFAFDPLDVEGVVANLVEAEFDVGLEDTGLEDAAVGDAATDEAWPGDERLPADFPPDTGEFEIYPSSDDQTGDGRISKPLRPRGGSRRPVAISIDEYPEELEDRRAVND